MAPMTAKLFLCFALACECGSVHLSPAATTLATDFGSKGRAMAEELQKALPASAGQAKPFEPAVDNPKAGGKDKESRSELLAAASLFNAASSQNTEEQQAAEDALRDAMSSPSQLGAPDRSVQENEASACLPDFTKCPNGWSNDGVLCVAGDAYSGACAGKADLSDMTVEQKTAFASYCSVDFPCQGGCEQDFRHTCPSLWREVGPNACHAPLQYEGACPARLDVTSMSDEDRYTWSARCAARWPCVAPQQRVYDYAAACPVGWYRSGDDCIAPLTYERCSGRMSFSNMSPAAKEDWASNCGVKFPCKGDRGACDKSYFGSCPAGWYAFDGGKNCAAPSNYAGACEPVLRGLLEKTLEEKVALEAKCSIQWPCAGEATL